MKQKNLKKMAKALLIFLGVSIIFIIAVAFISTPNKSVSPNVTTNSGGGDGHDKK